MTIAALAVVALAARILPRLRLGGTAAAAIGIAGGAGLLAYPVLAAWYASDPHFFDNAEPTIVSVAWIYRMGAPLYHAIDAPERYSHIYGPMAFIAHAWALAALGPSIAVSKWLAALAGIASLGMRLRIGPPLLSGATGVRAHRRRRAAAPDVPALLVLDASRLAAVVLRGDVALPRRRPPGIASALAVGLASGVLWNLKITGVLYSLPVLVLLAERSGARAVGLAVALGASIAALPFLAPNVSLINYLTWVRLSGQTGLLFSLLRQNLEWSAFLCLPLLLARSLGDRQAAADSIDRRMVQALAAGRPAGRPRGVEAGRRSVSPDPVRAGDRLYGGAPLRPLAVLALALAVARGHGRVCRRPRGLAAAQCAQLASTMASRRAAGDVEDLRTFLASHSGMVEMAYGRTEALSLLRPMLTFRNNAYFIDQPAVREFQLQGLDVPRQTIDAVRSCRVGYWLVPKGELPFSGVNGYASVLLKPLYPGDMRAALAAAYRLAETTTYFDVWQCVDRQ